MATESKAEYFRERRKVRKYISAEVDREKLEMLDSLLAESGQTRTDWINNKIDEALIQGVSAQTCPFIDGEALGLILSLSPTEARAVVKKAMLYALSKEQGKVIKSHKANLAWLKLKCGIDETEKK